MPVDVHWDNAEKTVMLVEYLSVWTWDEVYAAVERSNAMHDTVNHQVANIHDFTRSIGVPSFVLSHTRKLIEQRHPKVGVVVLVWGNRLVQISWQTFTRVYTTFAQRHTFLLAATVEEARALLKQASQTDQ